MPINAKPRYPKLRILLSDFSIGSEIYLSSISISKVGLYFVINFFAPFKTLSSTPSASIFINPMFFNFRSSIFFVSTFILPKFLSNFTFLKDPP